MADPVSTYPIDDTKEPLAAALKKAGMMAPNLQAKFESINPDQKILINKFTEDGKVLKTADGAEVTEEITGQQLRRAVSVMVAHKIVLDYKVGLDDMREQLKAAKLISDYMKVQRQDARKDMENGVDFGPGSPALKKYNDQINDLLAKDKKDFFAPIRDKIVNATGKDLTREVVDKNVDAVTGLLDTKTDELNDKINAISKNGPIINKALNQEILNQADEPKDEKQRHAYYQELNRAGDIMLGEKQYRVNHPQTASSAMIDIDLPNMPVMAAVPKNDKLSALLAGDEKQKLSEALRGVTLGNVSLAGSSIPALPLKAMNDAAAKKHPLAMKKASAFVG